MMEGKDKKFLGPQWYLFFFSNDIFEYRIQQQWLATSELAFMWGKLILSPKVLLVEYSVPCSWMLEISLSKVDSVFIHFYKEILILFYKYLLLQHFYFFINLLCVRHCVRCWNYKYNNCSALNFTRQEYLIILLKLENSRMPLFSPPLSFISL